MCFKKILIVNDEMFKLMVKKILYIFLCVSYYFLVLFIAFNIARVLVTKDPQTMLSVNKQSGKKKFF